MTDIIIDYTESSVLQFCVEKQPSSDKNAGVAQLVERHPSKVNVAGSSPVARSLKPADIAQG